LQSGSAVGRGGPDKPRSGTHAAPTPAATSPPRPRAPRPPKSCSHVLSAVPVRATRDHSSPLLRPERRAPDSPSDSLETWASSYSEQVALARAVAEHSAVKVILCGTNAGGRVEGLARLRRAGDAVVVLDAEGWLVTKCRWLPDCPRRFPRDPHEEDARGLH